MFRITEDPSSGSLVYCLAKNYNNDSILFFGMDSAFLYSELQTHTTGQNMLP